MKTRHTRIGAHALVTQAERLLLCRLSKEVPRWEGCWTLPGGGIEFGEAPDRAMRREVKLNLVPLAKLGLRLAAEAAHR